MTASGNARRDEQRANREKQGVEVRGKYEKPPQQRASSFYLALETAASGRGFIRVGQRQRRSGLNARGAGHRKKLYYRFTTGNGTQDKIRKE